MGDLVFDKVNNFIFYLKKNRRHYFEQKHVTNCDYSFKTCKKNTLNDRQLPKFEFKKTNETLMKNTILNTKYLICGHHK
jgi:hypothetical protein